MAMADADGSGEQKLLVGSDDFEVRAMRQRVFNLEETHHVSVLLDSQCRNPRDRGGSAKRKQVSESSEKKLLEEKWAEFFMRVAKPGRAPSG